jgi:hypothetical protein
VDTIVVLDGPICSIMTHNRIHTIKIKMYKIIMLTVLNEYETCHFMLREEHRLEVAEKKAVWTQGTGSERKLEITA